MRVLLLEHVPSVHKNSCLKMGCSQPEEGGGAVQFFMYLILELVVSLWSDITQFIHYILCVVIWLEFGVTRSFLQWL